MARPATLVPGPRSVALCAAIFVGAFGLLPIANWIPGGHSAPWYASVANGWISGTAIVIGGGVVAAILSRRLTWLWREGAFSALADRSSRSPVASAMVVATIALAVYSLVAVLVFDGRPLFIDELFQVLHARIFANGALSSAVSAHPEFFSSMHLVDTQGQVYSQFPAGGPAMLMLGELVNAPWLVGPVCGAVAVLAFASILRVAEPRPTVALGALLLFAFAPLTLFMSGSHMNHVPTLMWLLIATACTAHVMSSESPRPVLALFGGIALGLAATIRPVDALAFGLPAGLWYLIRAFRTPARWRDALAALIGVSTPVFILFWINVQTTGSPLLFGYEVLWGKEHGLGFHTAPWGLSHTPGRGFELINLYFLRLETYLFETPIPSLLPAFGALILTRRLPPVDRYLLASSSLLVGLYFAYWHDGFYLGPRFVFVLAPVLALWTSRLPALVRERTGSGLPYRATIYGYAIAAMVAIAILIPMRARSYSASLVTMRWSADRAAAERGIENALIFVRESWGAQLIARMWAVGVSRSETELLYRHVDSCVIEHALLALERDSTRGTAALAAMLPLLKDSARTVASPFSPDTTQRYLPGLAYSPRCAQRIAEDREGFTLFTPLLLARGGGNVYARDLHERNALLMRQHPDRPVYLLRPPSASIGVMPRFYLMSRDSLRLAWRESSDPG